MKFGQIATCALALAVSASSAFAMVDEVVITDCDGLVRATGNVEIGEPSTVAIKLVRLDGASATNAEVTLKGKDSAVSAVARNNSVVFESIGAGEWNACLKQEGFIIENISVTGDSDSNTLDSAAVIGAGVLGGGAAIFSLGSGGSSSAPATALAGAASNSDIFVDTDSTSFTESLAARRPTTSADECLNGESPTPLSPFL